MERRYIRSKKGRYLSLLSLFLWVYKTSAGLHLEQTNKQTGEPFGSLRVFIWLGKKRRGWMFIAGGRRETETHSLSPSQPHFARCRRPRWNSEQRKEFVAVTDQLPPVSLLLLLREKHAHTHATDRVLFTFCSCLQQTETDRETRSFFSLQRRWNTDGCPLFVVAASIFTL